LQQRKIVFINRDTALDLRTKKEKNAFRISGFSLSAKFLDRHRDSCCCWCWSCAFSLLGANSARPSFPLSYTRYRVRWTSLVLIFFRWNECGRAVVVHRPDQLYNRISCINYPCVKVRSTDCTMALKWVRSRPDNRHRSGSTGAKCLLALKSILLRLLHNNARDTTSPGDVALRRFKDLHYARQRYAPGTEEHQRQVSQGNLLWKQL